MRCFAHLSIALILVLLSVLLVSGAMADVSVKNNGKVCNVTTQVKSVYTAEANIDLLTPVLQAGQQVEFRYTVTDPEQDFFQTIPEGEWAQVWYGYLDEEYYQEYLDDGSFTWYRVDDVAFSEYSGSISYKIPYAAKALMIVVGYGDESGLSILSGETNGVVIPVQPFYGFGVYGDSVLLYKNQGYNLDICVYQYGNTNREFKYKSSNTNVVTVTDTGYLNAKATGKATITIKGINGASVKVKVTVKAVPSVKLPKKNVSLNVGQTYVIEPTLKIDPKASSSEVPVWSFKSGSKKIASVDKKTGLVVAKKKGTAKITVTGSFAGSKVTATLKVTVK